MPTTRLIVPASTTDTPVDVWFCTVCGAGETLVDPSDPSSAAAENFFKFIGWRRLPAGEVVCARCKKLPDIANILLAEAKAHTQ